MWVMSRARKDMFVSVCMCVHNVHKHYVMCAQRYVRECVYNIMSCARRNMFVSVCMFVHNVFFWCVCFCGVYVYINIYIHIYTYTYI